MTSCQIFHSDSIVIIPFAFLQSSKTIGTRDRDFDAKKEYGSKKGKSCDFDERKVDYGFKAENLFIHSNSFRMDTETAATLVGFLERCLSTAVA